MTLKDGYQSIHVAAKFYTLPGFFMLFMPILVPYNKVAKKVKEIGLEYDSNFTGMIEKSVGFGFGWVGLAVIGHSEESEDIKSIDDEFISYKHLGDYKGLGKAFKKVMADYPGSTDFYTVYVTDPRQVKPEENETLILFKAAK